MPLNLCFMSTGISSKACSLVLPRIYLNGSDRFQLQALVCTVQIKLPELQCGIVRKVRIDGTRFGACSKQRLRGAWRPCKSRRPGYLSEADHSCGRSQLSDQTGETWVYGNGGKKVRKVRGRE
jgi:hypothetical protein